MFGKNYLFLRNQWWKLFNKFRRYATGWEISCFHVFDKGPNLVVAGCDIIKVMVGWNFVELWRDIIVTFDFAFACKKWRRLKTKATNYVVNGASRQVSTETTVSSISRKVSTETTTSYISNGNGSSKEKDDEIHIVENGKSASNGTAEKQENKPKSFLKSNSYFQRIEKSLGKLY